MLTFAVIIFGLATLRTLTAFLKESTYESGASFIGQILVATTMLASYLWFLDHHLN